jgi:hypothetical protein
MNEINFTKNSTYPHPQTTNNNINSYNVTVAIKRAENFSIKINHTQNFKETYVMTNNFNTSIFNITSNYSSITVYGLTNNYTTITIYPYINCSTGTYSGNISFTESYGSNTTKFLLNIDVIRLTPNLYVENLTYHNITVEQNKTRTFTLNITHNDTWTAGYTINDTFNQSIFNITYNQTAFNIISNSQNDTLIYINTYDNATIANYSGVFSIFSNYDNITTNISVTIQVKEGSPIISVTPTTWIYTAAAPATFEKEFTIINSGYNATNCTITSTTINPTYSSLNITGDGENSTINVTYTALAAGNYNENLIFNCNGSTDTVAQTFTITSSSSGTPSGGGGGTTTEQAPCDIDVLFPTSQISFIGSNDKISYPKLFTIKNKNRESVAVTYTLSQELQGACTFNETNNIIAGNSAGSNTISCIIKNTDYAGSIIINGKAGECSTSLRVSITSTWYGWIYDLVIDVVSLKNWTFTGIQIPAYLIVLFILMIFFIIGFSIWIIGRSRK